jgi:hypothetical protein
MRWIRPAAIFDNMTDFLLKIACDHLLWLTSVAARRHSDERRQHRREIPASIVALPR